MLSELRPPQWDWKSDFCIRLLGDALRYENSASLMAERLNRNFPGATLTDSAIVSALSRKHIFTSLVRIFGKQQAIDWLAKYRSRSNHSDAETHGVESSFNKVRAPAPSRRKSRSEYREERKVLSGVHTIPPSEPELEPLRLPNGSLITALELENGMCKWPIGDPGTPGFGYCGRTAGGRYCSDHERRCSVKSKPRKPRDPTYADRLAGATQANSGRRFWDS